MHFLVELFQYSAFLALHDLQDLEFAYDVVLSGQLTHDVPFQYVSALQLTHDVPFQNGLTLSHPATHLVPFHLSPVPHLVLVVDDVALVEELAGAGSPDSS